MKDLILEHKDDWRMYGLVPYNLSSIQQGIQFGHALQEYNNLMMSDYPNDKQLEAFDSWRKFGKTFILLNGGTTNTRVINNLPFGSLNQYAIKLEELGVTLAKFYEPDLGEQLTAICFLVSKEVYNKREFLGFKEYMKEHTTLSPILILEFFDAYQRGDFEYENMKNYYECWVDYLGGEQNVKLREFLSNFHFA
jgi:hypothetical protein